MCDVCKGINSHNCPECGDQLDKVHCPKCRGLGYKTCYAVSIRTGEELEVTAETYLSLPENEAVARSMGKKYYRSDADSCEFCDGAGEMWQDQQGRYHKVV